MYFLSLLEFDLFSANSVMLENQCHCNSVILGSYRSQMGLEFYTCDFQAREVQGSDGNIESILAAKS